MWTPHLHAWLPWYIHGTDQGGHTVTPHAWCGLIPGDGSYIYNIIYIYILYTIYKYILYYIIYIINGNCLAYAAQCLAVASMDEPWFDWFTSRRGVFFWCQLPTNLGFGWISTGIYGSLWEVIPKWQQISSQVLSQINCGLLATRGWQCWLQNHRSYNTKQRNRESSEVTSAFSNTYTCYMLHTYLYFISNIHMM